MKRSIDWGHVIGLVFLYIILAGLCIMVYDTIIYDNARNMVIAGCIITTGVLISVAYCTYFVIHEFRMKEKRRKLQKKLAESMKLHR